ncbi:MAG: hypothetical protein ACLTKH_09345 [Eubacterium sp.]
MDKERAYSRNDIGQEGEASVYSHNSGVSVCKTQKIRMRRLILNVIAECMRATGITD